MIMRNYIKAGGMKMRYTKVIFSLALLIALTGCNTEEQTIGLSARGDSFDISNAEGETVSCRGGDFSGDMDLINQQIFEDVSESSNASTKLCSNSIYG